MDFGAEVQGDIMFPQASDFYEWPEGLFLHKSRNASMCSYSWIAPSRQLEPVAASLPCPKECPYLVMSSDVPCTFTCVAARGCSAAAPDRPFPNKQTWTCDFCSVVGCSLCSTGSSCKRCAVGFRLVADGDHTACTFTWDDRFYIWMSFLIFLGIALGLLAFLSCRSRSSLKRSRALPRLDKVAGSAGTHEFWLRSNKFRARCVQLARLHHHWCKVRNWYGSQEHVPEVGTEGRWRGRPLYRLLSLCSNLHRMYLVGVGMALYYNFMAFMICFFLLLLAIHSVIFWPQMHALVQQMSWQGGMESDDVCTALLDRDSEKLLRYQAALYCKEYAILSVVTLLACYGLGVLQKRRLHSIIRSHRTMRSHALSVVGFPPHATDEASIKRLLEEEFSKFADRGNGEDIKLAYVSIAYDASPFKEEELERLLDRLITIEDVRLGVYSHEFADTVSDLRKLLFWLPPGCEDGPGITKEEWLEAATAQLHSEIKSVLAIDDHEKTSRLRNSGCVFAVFKDTADWADVMSQVAKPDSFETFLAGWQRQYGWDGLPSRYDADGDVNRLHFHKTRSQRGSRLFAGSESVAPLIQEEVQSMEAYTCQLEPVSLRWHHFGMTPWNRLRGVFWALSRICLVMFLLFTFVLYPSIRYQLEFYDKTGNHASGAVPTIFGLFIGTSNWLICVSIANYVSKAGLLRQDREEVFIYILFASMCVFNTIVNVSVMVLTVLDDHFVLDGEFRTDDVSAEEEMRVAEQILTMLFPGSFIPCLLWPLQGFMWPFLQNLIFLRLQKPDELNVRKAEKALEPLPIGLAWDYQGSLTMPVLGCLMIFFVNQCFSHLLFYLAAWSGFFYCLQHFNHLRMAKMAYTTSNRLDTSVIGSWGIIVGFFSAGAAYWGVRAGWWRSWAWMAVAFLGAILLHWYLLYRCLRPSMWNWDQEVHHGRAAPNTLEETHASTLYDWRNCNPILVLKSQVVDLSPVGIPRQLPFTVGKSHAWEAMRRNNKAKGPLTSSEELIEDGPVPEQLWYEPASIYAYGGLA